MFQNVVEFAGVTASVRTRIVAPSHFEKTPRLKVEREFPGGLMGQFTE